MSPPPRLASPHITFKVIHVCLKISTQVRFMVSEATRSSLRVINFKFSWGIMPGHSITHYGLWIDLCTLSYSEVVKQNINDNNDDEDEIVQWSDDSSFVSTPPSRLPGLSIMFTSCTYMYLSY